MTWRARRLVLFGILAASLVACGSRSAPSSAVAHTVTASDAASSLEAAGLVFSGGIALELEQAIRLPSGDSGYGRGRLAAQGDTVLVDGYTSACRISEIGAAEPTLTLLEASGTLSSYWLDGQSPPGVWALTAHRKAFPPTSFRLQREHWQPGAAEFTSVEESFGEEVLMVDASVALPDAGGTLVVASVLEPFVGSEPPPPSARTRRLFVVDAQNEAVPFPPGAEVRGGAMVTSPPADVSRVTGRGEAARFWAGFPNRGAGEVVELDLTGETHRRLAAPPGTSNCGAPLALSDDAGWLLTPAQDAARPDAVRRVFAYELASDAAPVELLPPAGALRPGSQSPLLRFGSALALVGDPAVACLVSSVELEQRIDFYDPASGEHLGTLAVEEDGPAHLAWSLARLPNGRLACQTRGPVEDEAHLLVLRVRR